ncbi:MAG: T9SS type A sorting domain-containing protein [Bacteroidales bacterium]|nr:T9SS type A sorting domain-containing protein [Bacteroidales bacterium]
MKKTVLIIITIALGLLQLQAQNHRVVSNNETGITLSVTTGELQVTPVVANDGYYSRLTLDGATQMVTNIGSPELPMIVKTIEIPVCGDIHVTATAAHVEHLSGWLEYPVVPTQPLYHKSYTGDRTFVKDASVYSTDADYGMPLAVVEKAGIARNVCMADIRIYPVQVNPVTNEITLYDDITVTVTYDDVDMAATRELKLKYASPEFSRPQGLVNSIEVANERDALSTTPVKYLIIANDLFNGQLDEFANWKRRKGYLVEIAYTGTIGTTTTAIKDFITTKFNNATAANPAPTYVLLVGDVAQLPAYDGETMDDHVTDVYYFQQVGNDFVPDCYYGRFSAQTVAQLTPQVQKTLTYEQYLMPDPTYLDRAVLVAGQDGGSSGDYGYSMANPAMQYLEDTYTDDFFTTVHSYYNPHASSNAASIRANLSEGTGYANYSAHCGSDGWSIPSFSTTNVGQMTNTGKYGLMIGNCCQSNKFEENECFGEALLRANNKGAVGYIGGTDYTYWNHDYYWAVGYHGSLQTSCTNCNIASYNASHLGAYDCMFHTHNEAYSDWHVTQGAMIRSGNMAVQEAYGANDTYVRYYWEIYQLMGDPSVMNWLGQPDNMTIRIDNTAPVDNVYEAIDGTTSFQVSTGAPYSYIALTHNLTLVAAALSDANGNATLTFPALIADETYELAASAQNYKTSFTTIEAMAGEGARVVISDVQITNNAQAVANAHLTLDVTIENRFPEAATNTVISASTTSSQITLTDSQENVGTVNSGANTTLTASFALNISGNISDGDIAPIDFVVSYLNQGVLENTTYTFDLALVDALLAYVSDSYAINGGNNDNVINPGETVTITLVDANTGHATAQNILSQLSTYYNLVTINNSSLNVGQIAAGAQYTSNFTVNIGAGVPDGTIIPFFHHIYSSTNNALTRTDTVWLLVGTVTATETWESGDMSQFDWTPSDNYPWTVVNSGAYAGTYCARSGNHNVNSSVSDLDLTINVPIDGEISYYSKVSSENNYDFFKFYLDGAEMESRSGNGNWVQSTWAVTAGTHTLKFSYEKDISQHSNSDYAWVDNIMLPIGGEIAAVPEGLTITAAGLSAGSNGYIGEDVFFDASVENIGNDALTNVVLTLTTTCDDLTLTDATETVATVAANSALNLTQIFAGTVSATAEDNTPAHCTVTADFLLNGTPATRTFDFDFVIFEVPTPHLYYVSDSYVISGGNNDNTIDPGETVILTIVDENTGRADAQNVISTLSTYYTPAQVTNGTLNIGTVAAQSQCTSDFTIQIGADVPEGTIIPYYHHIYSATDITVSRTDTFYLTVGTIAGMEDWETGDFTQYEWTNQSTYPWVIVNDADEAHNGSYYAKSGNAGHGNTQSDLELEITTGDGEVSFYAKVASQPNADYFRFYIDNQQQLQYSGGVQGSGYGWNQTYTDTCTWQRYSYPVTAGTHTIRFSFTKNNYTNAGSDCAKVDDISWPGMGGEIAPMPEGIYITAAGLNAGSNGYEGENVTFDATLQNSSAADIDNVTLTLTTTSTDITLTDATELLPTVAGNATIDLASIFAGVISDAVADGTVVNCTVTADFVVMNEPISHSFDFSFAIRAAQLDDISHNVVVTVGNGDSEYNSGETLEVTITTENPGWTDIANVNSNLTVSSPYATIANANQTIASITAGGTSTTTYTVDLATNTPDNTTITFTHNVFDAVHGSDTYTFSILVMTPAIVDLNDISQSHTITVSNGDNDVNPGETIRIVVTTRNDGRADAHNAVSTLTVDDSLAVIANSAQQIGTIAGYATAVTQFDVALDATMPTPTTLHFTHTMTSEEDTCELPFDITVVEVDGEVILADLSHSISILTGNNDDAINPGETIKVTVFSRNEGDLVAHNITSTLMTTSNYATIPDPVVNFATAAPNANLPAQFNVELAANTPDNTVVHFNHLITDGSVDATSEFEITVVVDHTGVSENDGSNYMLVYPNPTHGTVTVQCNGNNSDAIYVYDIYGKQVRTMNAIGETTVIDLSDCAPGVYVLRICKDNAVIGTAKIVKE